MTLLTEKMVCGPYGCVPFQSQLHESIPRPVHHPAALQW